MSAGQLGAVGHSGPGRGGRPRPECHYPSPRRTPCRRRAGRWHTRGQSLALPLPAQARRPRAAGDSTASVKNLEGTKQPAASRSETTSAARVLPSPGFAPTFSVCLNVTQSQRPAWRRLEVTGQGRCLELRGCPCSPGLVPPRPRRARGQRRRDDPLEGIKSRLRPPVFTDRHVRSATLEHPAPPGTAGRFSPHSGDTRFSGRVKTHCWLLSLHTAREPSPESVSIRRKRRRRRASGLGHETFRQSVRSPLG